MIRGELPHRRGARARRPALHGKHLVLVERHQRSPLSRGAIIGFVQGFVQHIPVQREPDAPIVEFFQLAFNLLQTRAQFRQRSRFEGHRGHRHVGGLVGGHDHHICKTMVARDDPPREVNCLHARHLVMWNDVEPEAQVTLVGPARQLEVAPRLEVDDPLAQLFVLLVKCA